MKIHAPRNTPVIPTSCNFLWSTERKQFNHLRVTMEYIFT